MVKVLTSRVEMITSITSKINWVHESDFDFTTSKRVVIICILRSGLTAGKVYIYHLPSLRVQRNVITVSVGLMKYGSFPERNYTTGVYEN